METPALAATQARPRPERIGPFEQLSNAATHIAAAYENLKQVRPDLAEVLSEMYTDVVLEADRGRQQAAEAAGLD